MNCRFAPSFFRPLALTVGIGVIIMWSSCNNRIESFDEVDISKLPLTSYCEMKNNAKAYSGKIVRIDADLNWFDHGYYLDDPACKEPTDTSLLDSEKTAISGVEDREQQISDELETIESSSAPRPPVQIIAVGRFKYQGPGFHRSDIISARTPLHLEIYSIEKVSPKN